MSFKTGEEVLIKSLKKKGTITSETPKKGKLQVTIGCLNLWVEPEDLKTFSKKPKPFVSRVKPKARKESQEIDLHGLTVAQALEELKDGLNQAVISGCAELHVIHGKGTGKVKNAVLSYLAKSPFKKGVREKLGNAGTTIVEL